MRQLNNFGGFITSLLVLLLLESCSCNNQYLVPDFEKDINPKNILEEEELERDCNTDETAEQSSATQTQQEADTQEENRQEEEEATQEGNHHEEEGSQDPAGPAGNVSSSDNPTAAGTHATNGPFRTHRTNKVILSQEIMDLLYQLTQSSNPAIQNFVENLNREFAVTKASRQNQADNPRSKQTLQNLNLKKEKKKTTKRQNLKPFPFDTLEKLGSNSASNDNIVIVQALVASPQYIRGILNELIKKAKVLPAGSDPRQVDQLNRAISKIKAKLAALPLADDDQ